jgi:beta-lactamase superfamily II metal-dependent hydrolase
VSAGGRQAALCSEVLSAIELAKHKDTTMPVSFEIDFLPVGEKSCSGDAICLRYGSVDGFTIHVIDGGYTETTETIIHHLNAHYGRPNRIENVVLTHADGDHAAGLVGILEQYEVGALWMNRPWLYAAEIIHRHHANWTVDGLTAHLKDAFPKLIELEAIANRKGIPIYDPLQGTNIGAFTVLAPSRERYIALISDFDKAPPVYNKSALDWLVETVKKAAVLVRETWTGETLSDSPEATSATNESSVVQAARIDGKVIVLTGDVGPAGLTEAADYAQQFGIFQPAFFQVPHHGSRRNVTPTTLNRWLGGPLADPNTIRGTAFCSAAESDEEHPRKKVLNAFLRRGYPVHTTNGGPKCEPHNMPIRLGWSRSVPAAFATEVEE